jgi:phage terminase large subunit-like protein
VVVEVNNGGELATQVLKAAQANLPIRSVTASRAKHTRAEPIALLYEQGRVHHVGAFPLLEDECCTWLPGANTPDRLDALVWALTELAPGTVTVGGPMFGRRTNRWGGVFQRAGDGRGGF